MCAKAPNWQSGAAHTYHVPVSEASTMCTVPRDDHHVCLPCTPEGSDRVRVATGVSDQQKRWLAENMRALESSNIYVAQHGLPLARYKPLGSGVEPSQSF